MIKTKLVSSQIKAFIEDSIDSYKEISKASALLGEKYSFQLLYVDEGESDLPGRPICSIKLEGDLAEYTTVRDVRNLPVDRPVHPDHYDEQYVRTTPGLYPDILTPLRYNGRITIAKDKLRSLWFEVDIPKDFKGNGKLKLSVYLASASIGDTGNVVYDDLPPYYRKPCQLVQVFVDNGKYSFDFSYLDRWIDILDRVGIKYIEMSHFFHQNPYYHIADEPTAKTLDQFLQKKEAIADLLEGYPIMDALSDVSFYDSGAVDTPVPSTSHMKPFLERNMEEAFQDVRAMELCEKYYSHEEVVSAIEEELGEPITFERCAHSEDEMLRVRGKINRMIAQKLA